MNDYTEQNDLFTSAPPPAEEPMRAGESAIPPVPAATAQEEPTTDASPLPVFIDDESGETEEKETAAAATPSFARRRAPAAAPRPPRHSAPADAATAASASDFGARVRALRLRSGLSLEDVAAETMIKMDYLHALEEGDFEALPASVYVTAYLRRLCRLYGADAAESDALVLQLHDHLSYEIPDIAVKIRDIETDEHEQRKVRQIFFGIIAAGVLFVLTIVVAAVLLFAGHGRGRSTAPFDESNLLRLQPRAELELSILPAREPGK